MVKALNGAARRGSAAVNFLIGASIILLGLLIVGGLFFFLFGVGSTTTHPLTGPGPRTVAPVPPTSVALPPLAVESREVEAPTTGDPTAP